jgi:hypothetical protein
MFLAALGYVYGSFGKRDKAEQQLRNLRALSRQRYVDPLNVAKVYIGLGDRPQALAWLEKAEQAGSSLLSDAGLDPAYDSLLSEPRFRALLQRRGVAASQPY